MPPPRSETVARLLTDIRACHTDLLFTLRSILPTDIYRVYTWERSDRKKQNVSITSVDFHFDIMCPYAFQPRCGCETCATNST